MCVAPSHCRVCDDESDDEEGFHRPSLMASSPPLKRARIGENNIPGPTVLRAPALVTVGAPNNITLQNSQLGIKEQVGMGAKCTDPRFSKFFVS